MTRGGRILALTFAVLCVPAGSAAQEGGTVRGRTVDARTGAPVATVAVKVSGTVLLTFASDSGSFELRAVPAGQRRLSFQRFGYAPISLAVTVRPGATTEIEVALEPRPVALGGVVASVTKRELSARDAPVSVSVLEEAEIRQRVPETVADAVAYAPAAQFVGENLNIRGSSGYSRGAGSRVLLLIDGVPSNAGDTDALNWDAIPLTEVSRVEIVKGAGSALYGTSALGGVINVVTRAPPAEPLTRLRLRAGFYDDPPHPEWSWSSQTRIYRSADLSHGRRLGPARFWLRGGWASDDGFRQNGELDRGNAALRFGLGEAADTFELFASWARERYGAPIVWCTRGQCDDPQGLAFQPLLVPFDAQDDRTRSDKLRTYATHRRRWSETLGTFQRISFQRNDWSTNFGDDRIGAISDRYGGELRLYWRGWSRLFLTLGAEAAHTALAATDFLGDRDRQLTDLALFAQGELEFAPWLALTAGARGDVRYLEGNSLTDPWISQLSPRVGTVLSPDVQTRLRASLGRGFRAPSGAELYTETEVAGFLIVPNDSLLPEESWAAEVGLRRLVTPWLAFDVAGFAYEFKNLIDADTVLSERGIEIQFDNLPEARVRGLEAQLRVSLFGDQFQGQAAYTLLDTEDKSTGKSLAYRPDHLLTTSASFSLSSLTLSADYRFASAFDRVQVFTDRRLDPVLSMRVLDLRLAYRIGRQTIRLAVDNATNYAFTTVERNLEPIRRYTASLDMEF